MARLDRAIARDLVLMRMTRSSRVMTVESRCRYFTTTFACMNGCKPQT